jgi:hypothetical protein
MLLNWNWNVRIAGLGQSISLNNPEIPPMIHPSAIHTRFFMNSYDFAPECDENDYSQMSDVFSFRLILYELLSGQSVLSKQLTHRQIACMVAIPKCVLPPPAWLGQRARGSAILR